MPRTLPLFRLDPGWLYLAAGLVICAAGILVPATDNLGQLAAQAADLEAEEARMLARIDAYTDFLDSVDRDDPDLLRRLAGTQLNLMPDSSVPVLLAESGPASITTWIEQRVPARTVSRDLGAPAPTLLRRLATGPNRLWFLGAGVFCVFLGLMFGPSAARSSAAVIDADDDAGVAVAEEDPDQLDLFAAALPLEEEDLAEEDEQEQDDDLEDEPDDDEDETVIDAAEEDDVEYEDDDEEDAEDADDLEPEDAGDDEDVEYEYVDEDGNPIDPEDVDEILDEDGNPVEEDEEDVEYEYEYVDEDGNPIDPEDVDDDEYEYEEEDDEKTERDEAA